MAKNSQPAMRSPVSGGDYDRLETLLKNLPGMAYRCLNLKHWPMDFVSDGCYELCGYQRHEIESQQVLWGDFTHPDMIDEVDRKVRSAAENGQPFEVEYRIIARNGQEKWVWERGRAVDRRSDGVVILEGFITDITDRKRTEAALVRAEAYAQAIVESALDAVISVDDQGAIESFNQAASSMFGYRSDEIRGHHCRSLAATSFYREFDRYFQRSQTPTKKPLTSIELNGCDKHDNEFPIVISMREILDVGEKKYVILIRDLTQQRLAEREVREQRDMLAHVDRLNTLGEMAAGIAHEINQPLTAISMYAQSGLRFLRRPQPQLRRLEDALEKLSQQAHRAGAVIERMQEMTRPHQSHQEDVAAEHLLQEIHDLGEVEAQIRNFIIVLRLDDDLPRVKCDPIQIQQVILNLLRNGMESMRANHCKPGSKIVLQARTTPTQVRISIIDGGLGVSRILEKQLFQPFATTKASGMGLGLSISRSIIAAHGGQIEFNNNKTVGATFSFGLPRQPF
ncbi:MAG TPA: PAS domain S-box protein [Gammaproteobacteria bacterium]|nr:PAS domain S-box protein [Gammaproteobacteria bacterium]